MCAVSSWAGREPWTLRNSKPDSAKTRKASEFAPIDYPKPDGQITFDLLTNLQVRVVLGGVGVHVLPKMPQHTP